MNYQKGKEKDVLRARFTKWVEISLYRARLNYLKKKDIDSRIIYYDKTWVDIPDEINLEKEVIEKTIFDFDSDVLEEAFYKLSEQQREIITMLYLKEMKPIMIADILKCSVPQVYKQKNLALKALRHAFMKGGDHVE